MGTVKDALDLWREVENMKEDLAMLTFNLEEIEGDMTEDEKLRYHEGIARMHGIEL